MSTLSRRSFLKRAACSGCGLAATSLWAPRFSFAQSMGPTGSFDYLINILLVGGVDGTYILPPRDTALFNTLKARRPTIMGQANFTSANQVLGNQAIGLNPLWENTTKGTLPSVFDLYQQNSVAILSKVGFGENGGTRSHNIARGQWSAGVTALNPANSATWYSRLMNHYSFNSTQVWNFGGQTFGLLPSGDVLPISLGSLADLYYYTPQNQEWAAETEKVRSAMLDVLNLEQNIPAHGEKLRGSIRQIQGLVEEAATIRSNSVGIDYPNNDSFSSMCQDISRIIQHYKNTPGMKLVFNIELGGFDSHSKLLNALPKKLKLLNDTLAALAADLKSHAVWDRTAIACLSEFGRRLYENQTDANAGTDHGHGNILMVLGGSVRGSKTFGLRGSVPSQQKLVVDENLGVTYDTR